MQSKEDEIRKIQRGLEKAYEKLVAFKRYKNSPLIVSRNGKIVEIPPEDIPLTTTYQRGSKADSQPEK